MKKLFITVALIITLIFAYTFLSQKSIESVFNNYDDLNGQKIEELGCTASRFDSRILDSTATSYVKIETYFGIQSFKQVAWLVSGVKVTVDAGGCSHFGYSFDFEFPKQKDINEQELLNKAIEELKNLKLTKEGVLARKSVLSPMANKYDYFNTTGDDCHFPETPSYSWSYCTIDTEKKAADSILLAYTIAL